MVVDVEATPSEKKLRTTSAVSDEADDIAEVSAAGGEGAASGKSAGSATPAALEDGNESASETASAAVDVVDSDAAGISGLSSEEAGNLGVARSLPEKTAGAGCTLELDEEMNGGVEAAAVSKGGGDRQSGTSSADDGRKYREETAGAGGIVGGGGKNAIVDGSENVGDDVRVGEKYSVEVSAVMVGGVKRSAPEEDGIDAEGKDGVREREESGIGRPKAKRRALEADRASLTRSTPLAIGNDSATKRSKAGLPSAADEDTLNRSTAATSEAQCTSAPANVAEKSDND
ncbi:unnamed protein product, partial [Sphacelaria rigidula]